MPVIPLRFVSPASAARPATGRPRQPRQPGQPRRPRRPRCSRRRAGWPRLLLLVALLLGALRPLPAQAVDHGLFDALLAAHVRDGLVDYDAFAAAPTFARYLDQLARADLAPLSRAERLALWLNAYNAYTIAQINAHGERQSIRNINRTLGLVSAGGAWRERMATVAGVRHSLDDIEHGQIRPVFAEPRVHFALVCAARGCPPLRAEAYRADRLEAQLEDQAVQFLRRSPDKNRLDVTTGTVYLSRIFDWYGGDFAPSRTGVLQWLARYWPEGPERALLASGRARVVWTEYDWRLNVRSVR
jgi:hypothetical protein